MQCHLTSPRDQQWAKYFQWVVSLCLDIQMSNETSMELAALRQSVTISNCVLLIDGLTHILPQRYGFRWAQSFRELISGSNLLWLSPNGRFKAEIHTGDCPCCRLASCAWASRPKLTGHVLPPVAAIVPLAALLCYGMNGFGINLDICLPS